jgi:hypothetical protein
MLRLQPGAVLSMGSALRPQGAEVEARPFGAGLSRRTNVHEGSPAPFHGGGL